MKLRTRDGGCAAFPGTDPADSLSGCSRAISSSSSWLLPLLPRQEPLVSVSGSRESRSLNCLLASSSSTTTSAAFGEETPVRGRHELEDPVVKNSVMDLYPPGIRHRFDILTSLPTCSSCYNNECKWVVQNVMTPSYMITGKKGVRPNPLNPPGYTLARLDTTLTYKGQLGLYSTYNTDCPCIHVQSH